MTTSFPILALLAGFWLSAIAAQAGVTITRTNYHGWPDSYVISNGKVAAVVVPAVGRVIQFGFIGEAGVFWENRQLDGRVADDQLMVWATKDWVSVFMKCQNSPSV